MTPTNHHLSDTYLDAYRTEVSIDLRAARSPRDPVRSIRGRIARAMVRLGVSMMPERPSVVDGRIIVLAQPIGDRDLPEAA